MLQSLLINNNDWKFANKVLKETELLIIRRYEFGGGETKRKPADRKMNGMCNMFSIYHLYKRFDINNFGAKLNSTIKIKSKKTQVILSLLLFT